MKNPIKSFTSLSILLLLMGLVLTQSCTRFVADPDACYNDKVKNLLNSNCTGAGCHNTKDHKEDLDFTTYEGVLKAVNPGNAQQSELYRSVTSKGDERMPPTYSLTEEEKNMLKNWINNGAKNNSCSAQTCDTTQFTFNGKIKGLIKSNCEGCHKSTNASGAIILDSYANLVSAINKGNQVMGSIKQQNGYSPMPKNTSKLADCDIRCLEKWISAGMPEN
jgi:uncharacterized membrane protein